MKKLYSLGLDLGIASIGWALMKINENNEVIRIEDCGVKIFRKLEDDKDGKLANFTRRTKRGQRRIRRRRQTRLRDLRKLLKHEFNIEFFNLDLSNNSPWHIRLKGLKEKLTKEELSIALYHYCKHRGFKSNRKVDDDELKKTKSEDSVLLSGIESVANILRDKDITVVEYLANKTDDFKERIYNSPDNYMNTFSRKMIEDEINKLLDTQVKFGVCNDEFKNKYLKIWSRQRDFSEGPGKGSIYGTDGQGSIIEKMVGKCSYDNEMRAPKGSFSAESFVLLSMLVNLRYKGENEGSYKSLTKEEITKLYNIALNKAKITYKDVASVIGKDKIRFKSLELSKKEYIAKVKAFGKDIQENKDEFDKYINKTLLSKELKGLKTYHQQLNIIKKAIKDDPDNSEIYERFINNKSNFDKISTILLLNKTDNKIKEALNKEGFIDKCIIDNILKMKGINETINLSIPLCQKLIPFLLEGNTYDKAMKQLGFDLENRFSHINEHKYLPKVDEMIDELKLHLTNVNVIHVLTEARKLINALIKEYGKPQIINIELSRELALPFDKRRQKNREMLDNAYENLKLRKQIFLKYPHIFKSVNSVSNDDLLRYKLFKEQGGISPYSQKPIHEKDIFNHEVCEVDHILPYSRTFDDSYLNKALVLTSDNQEKLNRTPYEAFKGTEKWNNLLNYLNSNLNRISRRKKDVYLTKEISDDFIDRNLNDTKYASKVIKDMIEAYLKPKLLRVCNGRVTSHLKNCWGVGNFVHSIVNKDMIRKDLYSLNLNGEYIQIEKDELKINLVENRTNKKFEYKITRKLQTTKELSDDELTNNEIIDFVNIHKTKVMEFLRSVSSGDLNKLYDICYKNLIEYDDINNNQFYENLLKLLSDILIKIRNESLNKNRDNHLHHVTDAVVIACITPSLIQRVTKYYKFKDQNRINKNADDLINLNGAVNKNYFPIPYKDFRDDVKNRIYQRDYNNLLNTIKDMKCYQDVDEKFLNNLTVVYPSIAPITKETGPLHQETLFGERMGVITKRESVKNITFKNIDKILDKDGGNNVVYNAIKNWLNTPIKERSEYPLLPNGQEIKKVKLVETDKPETRIKLGEKRFAKSDDVIRVDVYKKVNDDRLYFVAVNAYHLACQKINKPFTYLVWYGAGNYEVISSIDINRMYNRILKLYRNTLVEIERTDGSKGLCYTGGLTNGILEIYSVLGDGLDLVYDYKLMNLSNENRYRLSVSTIKYIKVKQISVLGKVKDYGVSPSLSKGFRLL